MKMVLCMLLGLVSWCAAAAQSDDPSAALFDSSAVRTLQIKLSPEQWKALQPTAQRQGGGGGGGFMRRMNYPVVHASVQFEGKSYEDVALRYKGNSSFMMARNSLKKSIKLDFNKFAQKRTFFGQTTINLNNNAGDPSALRETLGYELFAAARVPAARTALVRVELNVDGVYDHKFIGLYTIVEEVSKRFLKSRFGESKGLLLKPDMARDLPYQGENWDAYKRLYVPKTEGDATTQKRFIDFLKLIHQGTDSEFNEKIESYLDVDEFLRFLAVNAATSNLDSILSMGHNFYIYIPAKLGPMQFIPWDLNEAFGGFGREMTDLQQLSLMHPHAGENKLIERLLKIDRLKQRYMKIVSEFVAGPFSVAAMNARIDTLSQLTSELMAQEKKDGLTVGQPGGFGGPGGPPGGFGGGRRGGFDGGSGPGGFGPPGGGPGDGPGLDRPADGPRRGDGPPGGEDRPAGSRGEGPGRFGPGDGGRSGFGPGGGGPGPMRGGPGGGGPGGGRAKPELKPFVAARNQSIADQLAGKSNGMTPAARGGPFGGGRPRAGRPGGAPDGGPAGPR